MPGGFFFVSVGASRGNRLPLLKPRRPPQIPSTGVGVGVGGGDFAWEGNSPQEGRNGEQGSTGWGGREVRRGRGTFGAYSHLVQLVLEHF